MVDLPPEDEEQEEALEPGSELLAIEQMLAQHVPYEQITASLDALTPPADNRDARASIAHTRLTAASMYQRDDCEISRAIDDYLAVDAALWRRLSAVLAACVDSPALFQRYVEPLITEAEARPDADRARTTPLARVLAAAHNARTRVLGR